MNDHRETSGFHVEWPLCFISGFDPFSVSSAGLACLLEEEQAEKEKAIRDQQEQQKLQLSHLNAHAPAYPSNFHMEWNGGGGYFPPQQLSPNSAFLAGGHKSSEVMPRPSVTGSSPIPHHFTTPPPGFPPGLGKDFFGSQIELMLHETGRL